MTGERGGEVANDMVGDADACCCLDGDDAGALLRGLIDLTDADGSDNLKK